jgi:hypothetical protein
VLKRGFASLLRLQGGHVATKLAWPRVAGTSEPAGPWGMLSEMNKQTFLAEIRATHEPLVTVVGTLADDAWAEPLPDMNGWTRKDALAHVGWWSDHSARVVTALRAGGVPYERDPDFDIDAQNRSILEEFRDRDPGEVRAFEAAAFERLVAAVEAASDEDLFRADRFPWLGEETLATAVAWDSSKHYPEHLRHLMA